MEAILQVTSYIIVNTI